MKLEVFQMAVNAMCPSAEKWPSWRMMWSSIWTGTRSQQAGRPRSCRPQCTSLIDTSHVEELIPIPVTGLLRRPM
jgi:hypothetical protein